MARTHDFRSGRNGWGHAIHAFTWREMPSRFSGHLWWRKAHRVVSVMVHTSGSPTAGDTMLYTGKDGATRAATIVSVSRAPSIDDMFTIEFERIRLASTSDLASSSGRGHPDVAAAIDRARRLDPWAPLGPS